MFVRRTPFPVIFAAAESIATAAIESWSQITNLRFRIINGTVATTSSVITAPTSGWIETAIQNVIHGISIVIMEGFFCSIVFWGVFSVFLTTDALPKNLSQSIIKEKSPDTVYICFPNASAPPISPREIADHTVKGVSMRVVGERRPSVKTSLPVLLSWIW